MATNHLDSIRKSAFSRIERSERNYKLAFWSALAIETLFIVSFVLLANLHDRLHLLILLAAVATYSIIGLGLFALGAHVSRNTLLVLKSIELAQEQRNPPSE
jgi:hypothetical protein